MDWIILNLGPASPRRYRESKAILIKLADKKTIEINEWEKFQNRLTDPDEIYDAGKQLAKMELDKKHINSMISDCQLVIEKLNRGGSDPAPRRDISRRSMEQRTDVWEPNWFDTYISPNSWSVERELTEGDRFRIQDALSTLSKREQQCYTLHKAMGFSYRQIASELLIKKGTVQYYIEEAARKIEEAKTNSLFLI